MIRIVKMTFDPEKVNEFLANFEEVKHKIRAFDGVKHLELLNDKNKSNIYFTYSIWESEDHLNNYRHSDLFKSVLCHVFRHINFEFKTFRVILIPKVPFPSMNPC